MPPLKNVQVIAVKSNEENPEPLEVLADSIIKVADAFDKIKNSRLKQRVIVLLIKDMHKELPVGDIEKVLEAVPKIASKYLQEAPIPKKKHVK